MQIENQTMLISIVSKPIYFVVKLFVIENLVKKFWSKKLVKKFGQKIWSKIIYFFLIGSKNIFDQKKFGSENIFGQKKF